MGEGRCLKTGTIPRTWGHTGAQGWCLQPFGDTRLRTTSHSWGHQQDLQWWGGRGTDRPRISPPAPSRSTSPAATNLSRSPPCARAAFKSPPRKKAQIKYYRCLFTPASLFSTANEGDFPRVGGRSPPPQASQSRGPLGDPPRPLYLLHLGTNIPGKGGF